jgi:hypothetical protein
VPRTGSFDMLISYNSATKKSGKRERRKVKFAASRW